VVDAGRALKRTALGPPSAPVLWGPGADENLKPGPAAHQAPTSRHPIPTPGWRDLNAGGAVRRIVIVALFVAAWMVGPVVRIQDAPVPAPVPQPPGVSTIC